MVLPLWDDNTDRQTTPIVNYAIIALNIFVFVVLQGLGSNDQFTYSFSTVPAEILQGHDIVTPARVVQYMGQRVTIPGLGPTPGSVYFTLFTSMFMHGGFMHLAGNMLFLWIFGDNVEDRMGHGRFVAFYLLCGAAAALGQTFTAPDSMVPMVGASGAVAGVMGAYFVLYPQSRIVTLLPLFIFIEIIEVPAVILLGLWFLLQLVSGVGSLTQPEAGGGVAFWAHAAGFVAGIVMLPFLKRPERQQVEWWDGARR